jgi:hypothetical protein
MVLKGLKRFNLVHQKSSMPVSPNIQSVFGVGPFKPRIFAALEKRAYFWGVGGSLEKEKITNDEGSYHTYERDPNNPKAEAFVVV